MYLIIFQRILLEALLDVLYFPLWWYTGGVNYAGGRLWQLLKNGNRTLAPGLWLKNILVPMYGQFDWQGRLISFFMRLAQIIGRGFALLVWAIVCAVLFLLWLAWPVIVIVEGLNF